MSASAKFLTSGQRSFAPVWSTISWLQLPHHLLCKGCLVREQRLPASPPQNTPPYKIRLIIMAVRERQMCAEVTAQTWLCTRVQANIRHFLMSGFSLLIKYISRTAIFITRPGDKTTKQVNIAHKKRRLSTAIVCCCCLSWFFFFCLLHMSK